MKFPDSVSVLLVDDDQEDYRICRDLLADSSVSKIHLDWCSNYDEALEAMLDGKYEAFLVDYRLGDESGLNLMRAAVQAGCSRPVLMLTGQGSDEIDMCAAECGAAGYLVKNQISPQTLERSIRFAIQQNKTILALQNSQKNLQTLFDRLEDILIILDFQGKILHCNPKASACLGYTESELVGQTFLSLHPPEMQEQAVQVFKSFLSGNESTSDLPFVSKFGDVIPIETKSNHVRWENNDAIACICRDISERLAMQERMNYQATHDSLTGLPNRYYLTEKLEQALQRAGEENYYVGVALINLDRFKDINETLGHHVGDELLKQVANRFAEHIQLQDTLARMGNDEYVIVFTECANAFQTLNKVEALRKVLDPPFRIQNRELYLTASIGVSLFPAEPGTVDTGDASGMLKCADIALDAAKAAGKNNLCLFESTMQARAMERMEMTNRLRRAVDNKEFRLFYQPQVNLASGKVVGVEALLRWFHPELGIITPSNFIHLVEESGLIIPLGEWVLSEACRQLADWKRQYAQHPNLTPIRMAINVSPVQFLNRGLTDKVRKALDEYDLTAHELAIEVTENVFMRDVDEVAERLDQLRQMGVEVHVDDFGSAYSSLAYLQYLPVDYIKIDQTFIRYIGGNPSRMSEPVNPRLARASRVRDIDHIALVKAIISLAHSLKLRVIAEGVETHAQLLALRSLFCDEAQGYLFSRPMPLDQAQGYLFSRPVPSDQVWNTILKMNEL